MYDHHAQLGAEFESVLGLVNLAACIDSLDWRADDLAQYFLAGADNGRLRQWETGTDQP